LLAVGAGSKMPAKRWPRERFRELGRRLLAADPALHLLVVGGKEDAALGAALCAEWGVRSHNLAGRLSIHGSAAVLQRCRAYVGNDAGAMHLAGMAGIPCAALFSARDYPGQWEPCGAGHVILRHETECAGCMHTVCPYDNKCLGLISVDEAERAVWKILRGTDNMALTQEEWKS
jgi:ADP-heptose:LPS heptosyltransferase